MLAKALTLCDETPCHLSTHSPIIAWDDGMRYEEAD